MLLTIGSGIDACTNIESFLFSGEWKAFVFLKCDPNEEEGTFNVWKYERTDDFVSEGRTNNV